MAEHNQEINNQEEPDNNMTTPDEVVSSTDQSPETARENTRTKIAQSYIYLFFGTIFSVLIIGLLRCFKINDFKDMLLTVSAVLSGPLGFIIGYYFKISKDEK